MHIVIFIYLECALPLLVAMSQDTSRAFQAAISVPSVSTRDLLDSEQTESVSRILQSPKEQTLHSEHVQNQARA